MQRALSNGWLNPELIAYAQAQREEKRPRFGRGRKKRATQRTRGHQALRASAWALLMGSAAFSYLAWSGTGSAVWSEWSGRTDLRATQSFEIQQAVVADAGLNASPATAANADNRNSIEGTHTLASVTIASYDAEETVAETSSSTSNNQFELRTTTEVVTPEGKLSQTSSEQQATNSLLKDRVTELREEHLALRESIARVQQQLLTLAEVETAAEEAPQES